jgi:hypothetical protein
LIAAGLSPFISVEDACGFALEKGLSVNALALRGEIFIFGQNQSVDMRKHEPVVGVKNRWCVANCFKSRLPFVFLGNEWFYVVPKPQMDAVFGCV